MPDRLCFDEDDLRAFLLGNLPDDRGRAIRAHLEDCPACEEAARRLDALSDPAIRGLRRVFAGRSMGRPEGLTTPAVPGGVPGPVAGRIGSYEVLGELGRGGMGVVYRARQTALGRVVALKMLLGSGHTGPEERRRFQAEAEAVARLQHPNIVQIHEVGQHDGVPFFSLEFCPGGSLGGKLDGTPWQAAPAAALVETLARAMQAAHAAGVIHRDLKPANVLLAADGTPKVTDFGLAKKIDEVGQTQTGAVVGTPSYMAPEQAQGHKDVGPAADVYALGAILYELLTGRPPFRAATALDTILQVRTEEPVPVRRLQPKVPCDLETVCLKCLEKDPRRRYTSARELADDLKRWQASEPIQARAVGRLERVRKWARRRPTLAALLGVTVLGVAGIVWKYLDAERQKGVAQGKEQEAKDQAAQAERAADYLASIFELADPRGPRGTMTARQILDTAEESLPQRFEDQPELRDKLLKKIGTVYDTVTAGAPLAMVLEARGTVQLQSTRNANKQALPQMLLYSGDRLSLGADGDIRLIVLSDLHQERLRPGTEVTIRRKGCEPADAVANRTRELLMTFVRLPKGTFYMGWGGPPRQKDVLTSTTTIVLQGQPFATAALLLTYFQPGGAPGGDGRRRSRRTSRSPSMT